MTEKPWACCDLEFPDEPTEYEQFVRRSAKLKADMAAASTPDAVKQAFADFVAELPSSPAINFWELRPMLCSDGNKR